MLQVSLHKVAAEVRHGGATAEAHRGGAADMHEGGGISKPEAPWRTEPGCSLMMIRLAAQTRATTLLRHGAAQLAPHRMLQPSLLLL